MKGGKIVRPVSLDKVDYSKVYYIQIIDSSINNEIFLGKFYYIHPDEIAMENITQNSNIFISADHHVLVFETS